MKIFKNLNLTKFDENLIKPTRCAKLTKPSQFVFFKSTIQ